jgi:hypothetical protein
MEKSILRTVVLKKTSTTDKLLMLVDDYSIYQHFIGRDVELGQPISSPIRGRDDNPSFCLFLPTKPGLTRRPDEIWFKDQADGRFGSVFTFVKHVAAFQYGLELTKQYEICKFISDNMDLNFLGKGEPNVRKSNLDVAAARPSANILYKSREFTKNDLLYWQESGVLKKSTLDRFNLKSVRYLLDESHKVIKEFKARDLAFVYEIHDKVKLYRPREIKQFKFRNKCPGNDPRYYHGFEQLQGKKWLVITKSGKDVMVQFEVFEEEDIDAESIAPHAESLSLDAKFVAEAKRVYGENILIVSDYDLAGVKFVQRCRKQFNLNKYRFVSTKRMMIDGKMKILDKDTSDYHKMHGRDKLKELIKSWKLI